MKGPKSEPGESPAIHTHYVGDSCQPPHPPLSEGAGPEAPGKGDQVNPPANPLADVPTHPGVPFDPDQNPMDRCIVKGCPMRSSKGPLLGITYKGQIAAICFPHAREHGLVAQVHSHDPNDGGVLR